MSHSLGAVFSSLAVPLWSAALVAACLLLLVAWYRLRQRYRRLSKIKDEWTATFDAIHDRILVHSAGGTITKINGAMASKLGITPKAAIGKACADLLPRAIPGRGCPSCRQPISAVSKGADHCSGARAGISTSVN